MLSGFRRLGWRGWLLAADGAAGMTLFLISLQYTTVAHAAVIYATIPFFAAAVGWLAVREVPGRAAVIASAAAVAGVGIMVGLGHEGSAFGDLLAVGMTVSMAIFTVASRHNPDLPAMPMVCVSALLCGLAALPMVSDWSISGVNWVLLALFGLSNSAAGLALFSLGARHLPSIETALIGALDAPLAPFWVWLVFGETPGLSTLVGGTIVFVAVLGHILIGAMRAEPTHPVA